ncbi:Hypothetical protein POVR2_LOCUS205 [uncultured virus]|nr:Hypothetical protein POVR2_LOCUS205 [uncultured virus]
MQVIDTLRLICYRLEDSVLFELWKSDEYRVALTNFYSDNSFFKQRSEWIVGRSLKDRMNVPWSTIYYSLRAARDRDVDIPVHLYGMHDLNSLLVIDEVYGYLLPRSYLDRDRSRAIWRIRTPEVLRSLLRRGFDAPRGHVLSVLAEYVKENNVEMVHALIELLKSSDERQVTSEYSLYKDELLLALSEAARVGNERVLLPLLDYALQLRDRIKIPMAVLEARNPVSWQLAKQYLELDKDEIKQLFSILASQNSEDDLAFYISIEGDPIVDERDTWIDKAKKSMSVDRIGHFKYVLKQINVVEHLTELVDLIANGPKEMRDSELMYAVLEDNRIDVMHIDTVTLRTIGYMIGHHKLPDHILRNEHSLYSTILRYLVLKRPSRYNLLDWMIELNHQSIALAAKCVLNNLAANDPEVETIRALLLYVRNKLRSETIVEWLIEDGMSKLDLARSIQLIDACTF